MVVIIQKASGKPIYVQMLELVKGMMIKGELKEGDALPSMRLLAKELRISVITTKRAYEELEREGFIVSMTGKGSFVAGKNLDFIKEEQLKRVEEKLIEAVEQARLAKISLEEMQEILTLLYQS